MKDLAQRFAANWKEKRFPTNGRKVLLACSGGVDSMVLGHLLLAVKIPFAVSHVNFGLRGKDADEDAAFVKAWCDAAGVQIHYRELFIKEFAEHIGANIQLAARQSRYIYFTDLRREHEYAAILTAHHINDVAETVLINLTRGTGIAGLHGIPEKTDDVIRPLLFATREEILAYAKDEGISWREDASNSEDKYLRNAIRHHILPKLEELMPGAAMRIAATADRIKGTETIYRKAVSRRLAKLRELRGNDWYIPIRLLEKEEALSAIAFEQFTPFGFSGEQIPHILELMNGASGKQILSPTHRVLRHRDFLVITGLYQTADLVLVESIPAMLRLAEGTFQFSWAQPGVAISENANTAMLHGDDLAFPLLLRTRKEGDYFYPLGMGMKKKKLKRFLIDIKTPLHEKDRIRILESDKKILWIAGKRIDERAKVRPSTRKILKVVFHPSSAS